MFSFDKEAHFSIDIETYGLSPDSVILSIGAVHFNPTLVEPILAKFYVESNIAGQHGRVIEDSVVEWWEKSANISCPKGGNIPLFDALQRLSIWIRFNTPAPVKEIIVWAKGIDFDISILTHAFKQYKIELPWKYNAVRDLRTLNKFFGEPDIPANQNKHNALEDAVHQAHQIMWHMKVRNG